jgi:hypothetical protein
MTKSFLFSTAAVLVTVTAASAADLPNKKAAPVEYVKVCKVAEGKMGFVVPGTDTCLQIGGFARFQSDVTPTYHDKAGDVTTFGAVGSINAVAYNQTDLGLLTGRVRIDATSTGASIDQAWLQLGGFTAGLFGSAYKFYDGAFGVGSAYSPSGAGNKPVQAQYQFNFGAGSFTVAIEDRQRTNTSARFYFDQAGSDPTVPDYVNVATNYAGQRVPDLVAAFDGKFGIVTAHLGGALHEVSNAGATLSGLTVDGASAPIGDLDGITVPATGIDSKWGFAVLGGLKADFTPADTLYLEAAYTSGATNRSESWSGGFKNLSIGTAGDYVPSIDADGKVSLKLINTYYGLAAFQHAWSPTVSTFIAASYLVIDLPKIGEGADAEEIGKLNQLKLALGATWMPVKNLSVSPEVAYINAQADKKAKDYFGLDKKSESNFTARLRIQRDF